MKKLSKQQAEEKSRLVVAIRTLQEQLESAIEDFGRIAKEHEGRIIVATEAYNRSVALATEFCENLAIEIEEYASKRSGRWQESDQGQKYQDWLDVYNQLLEEIEIEFPQPIDLPDLSAADILESMVTEVQS